MKRKTNRKPAARRRRQNAVIICRCEEVTEAEVRAAIRTGYHSLEELKRVLRTGMGHCQGRGCLRMIAKLVEEETGIRASEQKYPTSRPPLKPLPLGLLGSYRDDEDR
ncbi:MAG: (2Fe-2S)-binding protein [candidate division WOR-3 bacterium]